jgi:hypothetical protein
MGSTMAHIYNFAIIRVSPDPRRGETVNIGIAVFHRDEIDARILSSLLKVHALHEEINLAELYSLPEKINRLGLPKGSAEQAHSALRQIGMVELSELGQFRAKDKDEYETVVTGLMDKLVKPTLIQREPGTRTSRLHTELRRIINEVGILGKDQSDIDNHKIVANFPVAPDKGLFADFAGKNSKYYLTETIDYRVLRGLNSAKFNESTKSAFVFFEAKRTFLESVRTIVYAATIEIEANVKPHLTLLAEFATEVINFESAQDKARYIQVLARTFGGELPLYK